MIHQFYYLSPCARTSVMWLIDEHVESSLTYIPRLLSAAAQFIACEQSKVLPPITNTNDDHFKWLLRSAYNYQWGLSYYNQLVDVGEYVFKKKHLTYKIQNELNRYTPLFPDTDFTPPPCLFDEVYFQDTTEKSYRNYYKNEIAKAGQYRKMVTPWWVRTSRRLPIVKQPTQWTPPDPQNPFADLE